MTFREGLIEKDWYQLVGDEFQKDYMKALCHFVISEYVAHPCWPKTENIFQAFNVCRLEECRVVIIGQDPYPNAHAHGLAFSSLSPTTPPSLRYIFREIDTDIIKSKNVQEFKAHFPNNNLLPWAKQGVLLLNTVLTVREGESGSHKGKGWEQFTQEVVRRIACLKKPVVFLLWGNDARKMFADVVSKSMQELPDVKILTTGHPASGTHGKDLFSGCRHFSLTNKFLEEKGLKPIVWSLNPQPVVELQSSMQTA